MLQPVQFVAPGVLPARAQPAVAPETPLAVPEAAASARARNDTTADPGAEAERQAQEARARTVDPSLPVGPPPSFEANVLEAERALLLDVSRAADAKDAAGVTDGDGEDRPDEERGDALSATDGASELGGASGYGEMVDTPPHRLDLSR